MAKAKPPVKKKEEKPETVPAKREGAVAAIEFSKEEKNAIALLQEADPGSGLIEALRQAKKVDVIRQALDMPGVLDSVMKLMGSPIGFRTDRDRPGADGKKPTPYSKEVVRDCLIHARGLGLRPVNNEMNIISGGAYAAKNGYVGKLTRDIPGLNKLRYCAGVPQRQGDVAYITAKAECELKGEQIVEERKLSVRINRYMGDDALIGKAERKILKALFERVSGETLADGDVDDSLFGAENNVGPDRPKAKPPTGKHTAPKRHAAQAQAEDAQAEPVGEEEAKELPPPESPKNETPDPGSGAAQRGKDLFD